MKKILIVVLCVVVAGTLVYAQQVLSKNAVGYVRRTLDKGKTYLMTVNFDMLGGAPNTVSNVFPAASSGLPSGTIIYFWDPVAQAYSPQSETLVAIPPPIRWSPGTNILSLGRTFWMRIPSAAPSNTYELFTMGEVPDDTNIVKSLVAGISFVSFPYPVEVSINHATGLLNVVQSGNIVFFYNPDTGAWPSETYQAVPPPARWTPGTNVFTPGRGVLIRRTTGASMNQGKPYSWP